MQTDARGQRICLYYNDLNRLVSKHYCNDDSCPSNPTLDVKYIYSGTFFLDDFEDGIDSGDWDSLGSVSASNGQVHIVGNGDWQDWLKRDESTEDGQGARFSFKISTISALALPAFEQWTWNTTQFRRWGILLEDGKIKNESILGTNPAVKVDLLALKANTWYEVALEIDGGEYLLVRVRERDDPSVWAEDIKSGSQDWEGLDWKYIYQVHTGILDLEEYWEYEVNGLGLRTAMEDDSGSTEWFYDARVRLIKEEKVITGGGTFLTQWSYDDGDRLASMTYPGGTSGESGEEVEYTYHTHGLVDSAIGDDIYVKAGTEYDEAFRLTERTLGDSVLQTTFDYYSWTTVNGQGRLNWINTGTTGAPDSLQNLTYTYDPNGNVLTIVDANAGGTQTQTFTYDDLDRLYTAQASGGTGGTYAQETYTYNATTGNLASKAGVTYTYGDSNHPHAVTSTSSGWSFTYDANGNQDERDDSTDTFTLAYDEESRLESVSGDASATFIYDGDVNRIKQGNPDGTITLFVGGGAYGVHIDGQTTTVTKYYAIAGHWVIRDSSGLHYLLTDHLGSVAAVLDSNGDLESDEHYLPFSGARDSTGIFPDRLCLHGAE